MNDDETPARVPADTLVCYTVDHAGAHPRRDPICPDCAQTGQYPLTGLRKVTAAQQVAGALREVASHCLGCRQPIPRHTLVPEVGMGATEYLFSDREPYTITSVSPSGKTIILQRDKYTRTDDNGMSEMQHYTYERDPKGALRMATLRKDGHYRMKGSQSHGTVIVGYRERYYDFSY